MNYASVSKPFLGKVVAITGAGSGMGRATAEILWDRGASLAISDINITSLQETGRSLTRRTHEKSQQVIEHEVDISNTVAVESWIQEVVLKLGHLDHAANVAGGSDQKAAMSETLNHEFDSAIDVNLRGAYNCMRGQIKHMGPGSAIVNISSMSGIMGTQGVSLYSAAKGGLNTLTAASAREEGPKGIRINAITPGLILTPGLAAAGRDLIAPAIALTPLARGGTPAEIGKVIAFLLSDEASFLTGAILRVDGGMFAMGH